MFIGHYAVAPLAASTGKVKLWEAFIAVQIIDYAWALLVLAGVEKVRIVPGFTQGNALDLYFIPYTHSLLFVLGWSVLGALLFLGFRQLVGGNRKEELRRSGVQANMAGAGIIALLVLSHWFLDLIVHVPDLTLWPGSMQLGLGLWNHVMISFPIEILIMIAGFMYYLHVSDNISPYGILIPVLFLGFMVFSQAIANFGQPPQSMNEMVGMPLFGFTFLAFLAAAFERTRRLKPA